MQRYRMDLKYRGTDYFGWQRQPEQISVQAEIERVLTKLNGNHPVAVVGCGRTDTGVHAEHYVLHVDFPRVASEKDWQHKLNRMLPDAISIDAIQPVAADFHARFDALRRTYRYFVHTHKNAFLADRSLLFSSSVNWQAMNDAAEYLLGTQDFTSLSKLHTDVKTNLCTVTQARWFSMNEHQHYFEITADRFLRNMVRATVGTLLEVGTGKISPHDLPAILAAKDRGAAKTSVPAHALFLWKVSYPMDMSLETRKANESLSL